jgi:hypothetical protein
MTRKVRFKVPQNSVVTAMISLKCISSVRDLGQQGSDGKSDQSQLYLGGEVEKEEK